MDSPKYSRTDPAVLLLNEIEILLAQTRLMELCLKQAQAATDGQMAGLQEQYRAELTAVRSALETNQAAFAKYQVEAGERELVLQARIDQSYDQALQKESHAQNLTAELHLASKEIVTLRDRLSALQAGRQESEERAARELELARGLFDTELSALRSRLDERDHALRENQSALIVIERELKNEISTLGKQLQQQRRLVELRDQELRDAHSRSGTLEQRVAELDAANRSLAANAGRSQEIIEAARRELESEISTLRAALEEKDSLGAQQQSDVKANLDRLNGEIDRHRAEAERRRQIAEDARAELENLRAAVADREQETAQTERSRRDLELNWQQSTARRNELEERLQKKTEELRAAQSSIQELQIRLDASIHEWQLHVAEKQLLVESRGAEITTLKADLTRLSEQLAQRESSENETKADFRRSTDSTRAAHQAELTALEEAHQAKQKAWGSELAQERQTLADLNRRISELEGRYRDVETRLKDRENELAAAAAETATWRARFEEIETLRQTERAVKQQADRIRSDHDNELGALRHELQQKAWASAQQQAALENLALAHKNQIEKLEAQLDEQQRGIKARDLELESARSQAQSLERRIEELQSELQRAPLRASDRTHPLTRESSTTIDDIDKHLTQTRDGGFFMTGEDRTNDTTKQLTQTAAEMQEHGATQSNLEQALQNEVDQLMREAREKNRILQDRNDELVRVKAEMDQLQERLNQVESSASQTETELTGDAERMRREFQAQLALLQAELSQKEWVLDERQAIVRGLEQKYSQEIEALRQENEELKKRDRRDFVIGEPRLVRGREERYELAANGRPGEGISNLNHRRWNTGSGWKRRWRSSE